MKSLARPPIRFLAIVAGGWMGARAAWLWPPDVVAPALAEAVAPPAAAAKRPRPPWPMVAAARTLAAPALRHPRAETRRDPRRSPVAAPSQLRPSAPAVPVAMALPRVERAVAPSIMAPGADPPPAFAAGRWSLAVWAIARGGGAATPFAGQLGGSQAGARIAYALDADRRLAVVARVASAQGTRQTEAAIGLDWQPTRLPVRLVVEQRIAVDAAAGGTAAGLVGGVDAQPVGAGLALDAYGQAGVIARRGGEAFADGQLRLTRPIAAAGALRVVAGAGAWGAAQRDAARLDLGPTLVAGVRIGGRTLRVALDWRARVAGDANPGSGPALSIGTDF